MPVCKFDLKLISNALVKFVQVDSVTLLNEAKKDNTLKVCRALLRKIQVLSKLCPIKRRRYRTLHGELISDNIKTVRRRET